MDIIAQYSNMIMGMLIIVIGLSVLGMFIYIACQGNAPDDTTLPGVSQNRNVNGGIRHPYKDINSY